MSMSKGEHFNFPGHLVDDPRVAILKHIHISRTMDTSVLNRNTGFLSHYSGNAMLPYVLITMHTISLLSEFLLCYTF